MYKWEGPHDWLGNKLAIARGTNDISTIYAIAAVLAMHLAPDTIQDIFQREMNEDGYFEKVNNG